MKFYPPIDTRDQQNSTRRMRRTEVSAILNDLFLNNEMFQGLFPVYGDLAPFGQSRAHSRDRKRSWHGGCDLMYPLNTPVYPICEGVVRRARANGANGDANNRVVIEHQIMGHQVYSLYTHLNHGSIPQEVLDLVNSEAAIQPSQMIGRIGDSGSANVHLHFEILSNDLIEVPGFFGRIVPGFSEANPTRFRVTYQDAEGAILDKSWEGTVYPEPGETMVDQEYPDWQGTFGSNRPGFRTWMVRHKSVWSDLATLTNSTIPNNRICWHYHPVQFIAAMLAQERKCEFPLDIGAGHAATAANVVGHYRHIEKLHRGGYFPVGANTVWHGGVHLRPANDADAVVKSFRKGRIIGARLIADESSAIGDYGSKNFILCEHVIETRRFFALYMHLKNLDLSPSNNRLSGFRWLGAGANRNRTLQNLGAGGIVHLDIPVEAGDPLWITGSAGTDKYRSKLLHWEVFSESNIFLGDATANIEGIDDDQGDDFNFDSARICALFGEAFRSDKKLSGDELAAFYQGDTPEVVRMRRLFARFVSEWGIQDLEAADEKLQQQGWRSIGRMDRLAPYIWWKDALAAGVPIPQSPLVWHYHPVRVLEILAALDAVD